MSELEEINPDLSKTIIQLFEDDFTIPFLCRYRKDLVNNLSPIKLREIKNTIDDVKSIKTKCESILKTLQKEKLLTDEISRNVKSAKSMDELEHLSVLYKPPSKGSLYERAQKIGLEPVAEDLLYGKRSVDPSALVDTKVVGLKTVQEIEEGLKNIMSHVIAKNELVMNEVRSLKMRFVVTVSSTQVKQKKSDADNKKGKKTSEKDLHKFENYFNFSCPANRIRPHQILAINRGESLKVRSDLKPDPVIF